MTGSLQIRNDKYYAVLNFKDGNGKRKQKWVCSDIPAKGNRKKAQEFLRITIEEYDKADLEYADMPVWKYFTFWLETQENVVAKCTYRTYKGNMENHIIPYFREKGIKLHALKPFHLEDYYRAMMSTRKKDGSTMSPTTIQHHHQNISKALNDAVRREYIPFNPAASARTPKAKKYIGAFLNPSQIMEMLALFEGTPIEHPIQLISTYGLRRSEALGLSWQYVDFENEQFTIARTVIQNVGENYIKDNAKNDTSYRTLPMTPSIKEMLLAIRENQEKNRKKMGDYYLDSDFVFTWENGDTIKPNYLTSYFHDKLAKSDLPTIRLHDLRHSTASNLLANGFSVVEVQHWLGHSQPSTTLNFYSHVDSKSKRNISNALENLLPFGNPGAIDKESQVPSDRKIIQIPLDKC